VSPYPGSSQHLKDLADSSQSPRIFLIRAIRAIRGWLGFPISRLPNYSVTQSRKGGTPRSSQDLKDLAKSSQRPRIFLIRAIRAIRGWLDFPISRLPNYSLTQPRKGGTPLPPRFHPISPKVTHCHPRFSLGAPRFACLEERKPTPSLCESANCYLLDFKDLFTPPLGAASLCPMSDGETTNLKFKKPTR
jgi:hypothetical protein